MAKNPCIVGPSVNEELIGTRRSLASMSEANAQLRRELQLYREELLGARQRLEATDRRFQGQEKQIVDSRREMFHAKSQ